MEIHRDRLREDVETAAERGAIEADDGHTVLAGIEANRAAREYLVERFEDAGLAVRTDAVGTVVGKWIPESADPDSEPVAAGSHLDRVPEGGTVDEVLGVYAALEAVRVMQEFGVEPERPITVAGFTGEGRSSTGLLGSSVATGARSVDEALSLEDDEGTTLGSALAGSGFRGEGRCDASGWDAWLELQVDRSERLENVGVPVGVVTTIAGITRCDVRIEGEADHAGSTPMHARTDALAAASEFVLDVERAATELAADEHVVGTVGSVDTAPNATNVVPGRVELSLDVRGVGPASTNELVERIERSLRRLDAERGVETGISRGFDLEPASMADRCRSAIHGAADGTSVVTMDMHSGTARDTTHVASVTDAGMLVVSSRGGLARDPREWTDWTDVVTATRVLTGAMARLAGADER